MYRSNRTLNPVTWKNVQSVGTKQVGYGLCSSCSKTKMFRETSSREARLMNRFSYTSWRDEASVSYVPSHGYLLQSSIFVRYFGTNETDYHRYAHYQLANMWRKHHVNIFHGFSPDCRQHEDIDFSKSRISRFWTSEDCSQLRRWTYLVLASKFVILCKFVTINIFGPSILKMF